MVICLERGADLHMGQLMSMPLTVSCFSKIQFGFAFLVPDHPGSPGKRAVKRVCVKRVCVGPLLTRCGREQQFVDVAVRSSAARTRDVRVDCHIECTCQRDVVESMTLSRLLRLLRVPAGSRRSRAATSRHQASSCASWRCPRTRGYCAATTTSKHHYYN